MLRCAVCQTHVTRTTSTPYVLGAVSGRLCNACQDSLSGAVGRWLGKRAAEVQREREAAEAAERAARERLEAEQRPRGLRVVGGGK